MPGASRPTAHIDERDLVNLAIDARDERCRERRLHIPGDSVATVESSDPETTLDCAHQRTVVSRADFQELPHIPSLSKQPLQTAAWVLRAALGLVFLIGLLALTASIPGVNLLAMGYLMEVQGRVARTGKFRSAFYLLPAAQRLGSIVLAVLLWLLPIQFFAGAAIDSWLIAPEGTARWLWTSLLVVVSLLIATHLLLAIGCGGSLSCFVRPLRNARWLRTRVRSGHYGHDAHNAIAEFAAAIEFPKMLRLGLLAYSAAYLWLTVPTLLFTMLDDVTNRWQVAGFVLGCIALTLTLLWIPLLLAHVAHEDRWAAMFEFTCVRKLAGQTPFCWALATAVLFACSAIPLLYTALIKIQIPPHEARWDLMLVFLLTVVPARILVGWVYHRATQQKRSTTSWAWRIWQWINAAALCAGIGFYVYFLNLASTGGELGERGIWQFHAVLLPFPF